MRSVKVQFICLITVLLLLLSSAAAQVTEAAPNCPGGCGDLARCVTHRKGHSMCVCNLMYAPENGIPPPVGYCRVSPATVVMTIVLGGLALALIIVMIIMINRAVRSSSPLKVDSNVILPSTEGIK